MSVEQLSQYAGVLLSLLIAYIPGVDTWYAGKEPRMKATIMAGVLAIVSLGIFGLSCLGWVADLGVACTQASAIGLVKVFISALIANQVTYIAAVRPFKR